MTAREASFRRQPYRPHPHLPQPYLIVTSHGPPSNMAPPRPRPTSPWHARAGLSAAAGPLGPPAPIPGGGPLQAAPSGMIFRKPEPLSWIKYPVEPHRMFPGPYAAVDVPFEEPNGGPSLEAPKRSKSKMSSTWGPQKLKCLEKSRKCVRFASTWGPARPGPPEYATINPHKLTSRYVRPAVFRRSNLKIDPKYE